MDVDPLQPIPKPVAVALIEQVRSAFASLSERTSANEPAAYIPVVLIVNGSVYLTPAQAVPTANALAAMPKTNAILFIDASASPELTSTLPGGRLGDPWTQRYRACGR